MEKQFGPPVPKVYGTVTVGERGQVVIPVKVRKSYHLSKGDQLIVIAAREGGPIGLIPAQQFGLFIEQHEKILEQLKRV